MRDIEGPYFIFVGSFLHSELLDNRGDKSILNSRDRSSKSFRYKCLSGAKRTWRKKSTCSHIRNSHSGFLRSFESGWNESYYL